MTGQRGRGTILGRRRIIGAGLLTALVKYLSLPAFAREARQDETGLFRNNYLEPLDRSFSDLRKAFSGERPPLLSFPLVDNDPVMLQTNRSDTTLTWVGHCTLLLQVGGLNILTDPHFTNRASPVPFMGPQRGTPPGLRIRDLPTIDIILVSHNHYDHLDFSSMLQLAEHSPDARVLVPLKLKRWFTGLPFTNVTEHDWWEETSHAGARLTAVPTQHWSRRSLLDRNETLWCGWALHVDGFSFLFIGDSGYTQDYRDINERLGGFDLAAIPIGAYAPRWFMGPVHQNPEEAVACMGDLGARRAVATHWGTFPLTYEPMDEPPRRLAAAMEAAGRAPEDFMVFAHGETRVL